MPWLRHKDLPRPRRLLVVMMCAAVLSVLLTRVIPASYVAESSILLDPGGDGTNLINLAQISDLLPPGALASQSKRENGYAYLAISRSRAVLSHLLNQRQRSDSLRTYYDRIAPPGPPNAMRREVAIRRLRRQVKVGFDARSGVLQLSVSEPDRTLAADIANELIAELRRFNKEVRTSRAIDATNFVEGRLIDSRAALSEAEDKLATFREANARIGNAPELQLRQKRLERNVRFAEDIYSLLNRQLELARIQEKREAPVFSLMDEAVPPTKPARFSWLLAALLGAFASGLLLVLGEAAVVGARQDSERSPADSSR